MDAGLKACWDEDWDKVALLARTPGAALNGVDDDGWCMMHHAVWHGRQDTLDLLLRAGADPGIQDKEGLTPGTLACSKQRWNLAQSVATHGKKLDLQDVDGWSMLHYAAAFGQEPLLACLLAKDADASLVDAELLTPGLAACAKAQWGTAMILAEHGAALGAQDEDGWSMAHYAVDNNQPALLDLLILSQAPLGAKDSDGFDPASRALSDPDHFWAVPKLVAAGAGIDPLALTRAGLDAEGRPTAQLPLTSTTTASTTTADGNPGLGAPARRLRG